MGAYAIAVGSSFYFYISCYDRIRPSIRIRNANREHLTISRVIDDSTSAGILVERQVEYE